MFLGTLTVDLNDLRLGFRQGAKFFSVTTKSFDLVDIMPAIWVKVSEDVGADSLTSEVILPTHFFEAFCSKDQNMSMIDVNNFALKF